MICADTVPSGPSIGLPCVPARPRESRAAVHILTGQYQDLVLTYSQTTVYKLLPSRTAGGFAALVHQQSLVGLVSPHAASHPTALKHHNSIKACMHQSSISPTLPHRKAAIAHAR